MDNKPDTPGEGDSKAPEEKEKTQKEIEMDAKLEKLDDATRKLNLASKRYEQNRALAEADKADAMLDGKGEVPEKKKGMTDQEYAKKVLAGEKP